MGGARVRRGGVGVQWMYMSALSGARFSAALRWAGKKPSPKWGLPNPAPWTRERTHRHLASVHPCRPEPWVWRPPPVAASLSGRPCAAPIEGLAGVNRGVAHPRVVRGADQGQAGGVGKGGRCRRRLVGRPRRARRAPRVCVKPPCKGGGRRGGNGVGYHAGRRRWGGGGAPPRWMCTPWRASLGRSRRHGRSASGVAAVATTPAAVLLRRRTPPAASVQPPPHDARTASAVTGGAWVSTAPPPLALHGTDMVPARLPTWAARVGRARSKPPPVGGQQGEGGGGTARGTPSRVAGKGAGKGKTTAVCGEDDQRPGEATAAAAMGPRGLPRRGRWGRRRPLLLPRGSCCYRAVAAAVAAGHTRRAAAAVAGAAAPHASRQGVRCVCGHRRRRSTARRAPARTTVSPPVSLKEAHISAVL